MLLVNQKEKESDPDIGHKTGMVGVLPLYHSFAMSTVMNVSVAAGSWMMLFPKPPETEELLKEIYVGFQNGSLLLTSMGIRAVLEFIMIDKVFLFPLGSYDYMLTVGSYFFFLD